jgi:ATP-dependent Clp protease ATP-binding subunit ClpA
VFERFTQDARDVVVRSRGHAKRLGDHWIDTPHLMLALVDAGTPNAVALAGLGLTVDEVGRAVAELPRRSGAPTHDPVDDAQALAAFGIDVHAIREAVEAGFGPGALDRGPDPSSRSRSRLSRLLTGRSPKGGGWMAFSTDAKTALELSLREALRLKDRELREEHLALGLLRGGDDRTRAVLDRLGVDPSVVRSTIEARLHRVA